MLQQKGEDGSWTELWLRDLVCELFCELKSCLIVLAPYFGVCPLRLRLLKNDREQLIRHALVGRLEFNLLVHSTTAYKGVI